MTFLVTSTHMYSKFRVLRVRECQVVGWSKNGDDALLNIVFDQRTIVSEIHTSTDTIHIIDVTLFLKYLFNRLVVSLLKILDIYFNF